MKNEEILDIVDEQGNVIGQAPRTKCHRNPKLIHQVVHCWIFNKRGQILWQHRSIKKDSSPGLWDMSCGGHVSTGEKPLETLLRELYEELGIKLPTLEFVEKYIRGNDRQTELIYLYYLIDDRPKNEFKIDADETQKVQWIDVYEAQMKVISKEVDATDFIFSQVSRIFQKVLVTSLGR